MVKQAQTICPQQPTNCLSLFDHFVRLALDGLTFLTLSCLKVTRVMEIEALLFGTVITELMLSFLNMLEIKFTIYRHRNDIMLLFAR